MERRISTKKCLNTCLPKSLLRQFLYKKLSEQKSMPTNSSRNLDQKTIGRNISTRNSLKRNLDNTMFEKNLRPKIWGNYLPNITWKEVSNKKIFEAEIWGKSYSWKPCIFFRRCPAKNVWNKLTPKQAKLLSVVISCYQKQAKLLSVVIV